MAVADPSFILRACFMAYPNRTACRLESGIADGDGDVEVSGVPGVCEGIGGDEVVGWGGERFT